MNIKITPIQAFGLLIEPKKLYTQVSDVDIASLETLVRQEQLIVLRGFQTFSNAALFANYCEGWGEISIWPFGKVLELIEHDQPEDHIFDSSYVPLHWDGMYRPQIPELQIFHCVTAPLAGYGGRTTFSNTILALKQASTENKTLWDKVTGIYQRKMAFYNSKTVAPIIDKHPYENFSVIRYNEPLCAEKGHFVNSPIQEFKGIPADALASLHQSIHDALYASSNYYAHEWQTGDIVIADNFSLLHGREAFVSKSPRHIQRVHILSKPPFNNPGLAAYDDTN